MRVLFDTNVILDFLLDRKPFDDDSFDAVKKTIFNGDKAYISSNSITDIYYLIHREYKKKENCLKPIKSLFNIFYIAEVNEKSIELAISSKLKDFEDAVLDSVGYQLQVDYIITRNKNDFKDSLNMIVNPTEFLKL